ncbi:MAG TPA: SRPBCC family protein, partial [Chloroflexota bacterium]|nr:SRPBCC family protein [Chloroflexota bacterium]
GDYRTGRIGRQPIIVSHGEDGQIHVLLNTCRHRGNVVCREERGTSNFFRCAYHGWVYKSSGALVGIAERSGYGDDFGQDIQGLVKASRMTNYRGLIFASLSRQGESLEDYLGPVKEYVDLWIDRAPGGNLRVLRPHKSAYPGNWKLQAENGSDGYHGRYVHESAFKTAARWQGTEARQERNTSVHGTGWTRGFPHGHNLLEKPGTRGELPPDMLRQYMDSLVARHGAERAERIAMVRHVFIFPNVYLMDDNVRVIRPISVDHTEVDSYVTFFEDMPDAMNSARLKNLQWRLGTAGLIGTDDLEMFAGCQTGMQAAAAETVVLGRGLQREEMGVNGETVGQSSDETPQRAIYREWARLMGKEYSSFVAER